MANTKSAEKALRQSKKRAVENTSWKNKIKALVKSLRTSVSNPDILKEQYQRLQSVLDKAVKNKVIHKNKAARIKSEVYKAANARLTNINKPTRTGKSKSH